MERRSLVGTLVLGGSIALCVVLFGRRPAAAMQPTDPNEVLETLPVNVQGKAMRRALAANPNDLPRAVRLARLDIEIARQRSDPRYLGHAQAALAPWWGLPHAPVEVLVLRATIEQSLHDFDSALVDLDRALEADPEHVQAWLTRAVVLSVRGRYEEARASCAHVARLAPTLVTAVCTTSIDSLTGKPEEAYQALSKAIALSRSQDERAWAISTLAEIAERAGRLDDAESHFKEALAIDADDSYSRAALADLLIDRGRPLEALELVKGREENDTLLLRIAIAEKRAGLPADAHIALLASRFEAQKQRGDVVHRREEARFHLELLGDKPGALALAKANWEVQKEPADKRILEEASRP